MILVVKFFKYVSRSVYHKNEHKSRPNNGKCLNSIKIGFATYRKNIFIVISIT